MMYAIEAWGAAYKSNIAGLQFAQNKMLKLVLGYPARTPTLNVFLANQECLPVRAVADLSTGLLLLRSSKVT